VAGDLSTASRGIGISRVSVGRFERAYKAAQSQGKPASSPFSKKT
jgi:hypothetical protein